MLNKKSDWFIALLVIIAFTIAANIYGREKRVLTTKTNFSSVCGISTESALMRELNFGSGILLSDGMHVITNMHVIDRNKDAKITEDEKSISCTFLNSRNRPDTISNCKVIWTPGLQHFRNLILDLAIIKLPHKVAGGVRLMPINTFRSIPLGHSVYAIGCPGGKLPPHITFGTQSSQFQPQFSRAGISVWFGNSGGGVFSAQSGECMGIVSKLNRDGNGHIIPEWTEYITVERIIPCLKELGIE